jgi:hypothetical protein
LVALFVTMRTTILATALGAAALAVAPSVASAEYYMGKGKAESFARDYAKKHYDSSSPEAYCRPQGANAPKSGYIYHRWVCGWADEYGCAGRLLITGSRGSGYYYGTVLRGQRCP